MAQVAIGLFLALWVAEYFNALSASDCRAPPAERTQNCYPWGMTEGPMGGDHWNYRNKENYLLSTLQLIAAHALAALTPFVVATRRNSFIAMAILIALGYVQPEWLYKLL